MPRRARSRLGAPAPTTVQPYTVPASVGGINTLDSLMMMPPVDCIYTYNLMPAERGLQLRKGYREWANGCGTKEVRTILPYQSQTGQASKLWAVTEEGIYDVTTQGDTSPAKDVTFSIATSPAGYGVKCEFTNDAAEHYLFYADGMNGLHQYEETGGTWSVPTSGTAAGEWSYNPSGTVIGFPVTDIAFVTVFKQRIWVILKESDDAWYLPVASISGQLTKFVFGAKLPHGGDLMGLWNWTVDGGDGVDDMLIAISRGGDVAVYQGGDPSLADFALIGSWFIGVVPSSRRIVNSYGSEMYILSTFGITSLRDLLQGAVSNDLRTSPSAKINRDLRVAVQNGVTSPQWALNIYPADGFMQVVAPQQSNGTDIQYNQNLSTKAWGLWEDVPMISSDTWEGEYYIGADGGVVYEYYEALDGVMIDGTVGEDINYRTLTSFQAPGSHSTFKRVGFVRTLSISSPIASFNAVAVYDYDENANLAQSSVASVDSSALWDSALWDQAIWGNATSAYDFPKGALGMGRTFAIQTRGHTNVRIEVIGWDICYQEGGLL